MSTDKGYIKLYRDIREHWLWQDEEFSRGQAWIDLIMMMNHKDKETMFDGRLITVKRGSKITSIRKLSERWRWSRHKVSDFLNILEETGMILQLRDSRKTLITLIKYEDYQGRDGKSGPLKSHRRATEEPPKDISGTSEGHKQEYIKNEEDIKKKEEEDEPQVTDEQMKEWGWM